MTRILRCLLPLLAVALVFAGAAPALAAPMLLSSILRTDFDNSVSRMWSNNVTVNAPFTAGEVFQPQDPTFSVWGTSRRFATTPDAGTRHLRFGFTRPVTVGTIILFGDVVPSALKADAPYPGDITNEDHWTKAEWLRGSSVNPAMRPASEYTTWTFPTVLSTRAIRFTKVNEATDANSGGRLGGAYLLPIRLANVAGQAEITASTNSVTTANLKDFTTAAQWNNGSPPEAVSAQRPEKLVFSWPAEVTLAGFLSYFSGISDVTIQRFIGGADDDPKTAADAQWQDVKTFAGLRYSTQIQTLDLDGAVSSRAFRWVITKAVDPAVDSSVGNQTLSGRRVFSHEILALHSLNDSPLATAAVARPCDLPAPIGIPFHLDQPGYVTLVIEGTDGKRVRNLVAEMFYPAGDHLAFWDGLDESGRIEGRDSGEYTVVGNLVGAGTYRVRGLVRDELELRYEFTVNNSSSPPWGTTENTGGWVSDHRPASDIVFVPGRGDLLIAAEVGESSTQGIFVDLEGRRRAHVGPLEEGFYFASHLARDAAQAALQNVAAYSAVLSRNRMYLHRMTTNIVATQLLSLAWNPTNFIGGLAVHNQRAYLSVPASNVVHVIDTVTRVVLASANVQSPRGLAIDGSGRLLVLSGTTLARYTIQENPAALLFPESVVSTGLEDPQRITFHAASGQFYISDWGSSHQVKVFSGTGELLRAIGEPGGPQIGAYNKLRMHRPNGTAITPDGKLWVAEYDMAPKRVSVWNLDGTFDKVFYGPPKYGGGGRLDPADKTRFYYTDADPNDPIPFHIGVEFKLDWTAGTSEPVSIYSRYGTNTTDQFFQAMPPETAVYMNNRQYMINTYNAGDVSGSPRVTGIWIMGDDGIARLVGAFGRDSGWPVLMNSPFRELHGNFPPVGSWEFIWSDLDGDHIPSPLEVTFVPQQTFDTYGVAPNLDLLTGSGKRYALLGFALSGAPLYNIAAAVSTAPGYVLRGTSGGGEIVQGPDDWVVVTGGPMRGYRNGEQVWTYPSQWPSLHASQRAPASLVVPRPPGLMLGTTRLLGAPFTPVAGEAGQVWAINGNYGDLYLMTMDGLFVGTLFRDIREGPIWRMPLLPRNSLVNELTLNDESFWPSITQTADGNVYLVCGKNHSSIVRVDGLNTIRRLAATEFTVTTDQLASCIDYQAQVQLCKVVNPERLFVPLSILAPTLDGNLSEWAATNFVGIDNRATGAVMVANGRLYAAWNTESATLATNSGAQPDALFKTGGALDLMIGVNAAAPLDRTSPVLGDIRLLVTKVGAATRAHLYRQVAANPNPVTFTSPVRTVTIQRIDDVSADVQFAGTGGRYEISVPLATLGLEPQTGQTILGDIGVLRGSGGATVQRSYWQNKATGLVSDTPSEAELTPRLWGRWVFQTAAAPIVVATASLPGATQGAVYSATLQATGGSGSFNWTVSAGALPTGLTLGANGAFSGTPTVAGTFNFTVRAADGTGSGERALSLVVAPAPLQITTDSALPPGSRGSAYSVVLTASGGTPPYTWTHVSGPLPPGLSFAANGQLSGTSDEESAAALTMRVTDAVGASVTADFALRISSGVSARGLWREQTFGLEASVRPTAMDNADPDGDGLSNIIEYAFGTNPNSAAAGEKPSVELRQIGNDQFLAVTFTSAASATDVQIVVESAAALGTWTADVVEVSRVGEAQRTITVRSAAAVTSPGTRFLRLSVVKQ